VARASCSSRPQDRARAKPPVLRPSEQASFTSAYAAITLGLRPTERLVVLRPRTWRGLRPVFSNNDCPTPRRHRAPIAMTMPRCSSTATRVPTRFSVRHAECREVIGAGPPGGLRRRQWPSSRPALSLFVGTRTPPEIYRLRSQVLQEMSKSLNGAGEHDGVHYTTISARVYVSGVRW